MARLVPRSTEIFLCYDLGGTKLRAALVTAQGRLLAQVTSPVDLARGLPGLIHLFVELAKKLPRKNIKAVSIASAGPLHPQKGLLLDPTNFFTDRKSWGIVPLVSKLKKIFRKPVLLENDAAAAVLGELWKGGHGRKAKNIVAITLGTGVGVGVITNGQLLRAGQGLHPEGGHIPLNSADKDYPCACGAYGCIEAYLAGSHFSKRLSVRLGRKITGIEAVQLGQAKNSQASEAFKEYGQHLAEAVRSLCILFAPEVVVLSGGFSHAASLYLPETERALPILLKRYRQGIDLVPQLKISKLQNDAGILGAAYIAKNRL